MTPSTVVLLISARYSMLFGAPCALAHSSDHGSLYQNGIVTSRDGARRSFVASSSRSRRASMSAAWRMIDES